MDQPVLINAQVQLWSAKAGMSKSRSAFIETFVGKREVKLILYFSTGKIKALQLHNNIKSVVLRTYGEDQNYLHLTFKNNDFLFVEKLITTDARRLKRFLDKIYQNSLRASRRSDERSGEPSMSAQEFHGSPPPEVHMRASSKCFESAKESEMCMFRGLSLFPPSSASLHSVGLLETQLIKRKRFLPDFENEKYSILKGSIREFEANLVVSISNEKGKERGVRAVEISNPGFGFPFDTFETNYPEDSGVNIRDLNDLITKFFSPVLLESHYIENCLDWHDYMKTFLLHPEKSWQGLPNVGNTCYINVVLQSLCSIPLFINDLFNQGFPWIKPPKDNFNMRLMQLLVLKDIYNARTRQRLLIGITKALPVFGEIFAADRQNDAHEFLSLCLVQLKESVQRVTMMWQSEDESGDFNLLREIFANYATISKIHVCPVTNNFEFELLTSIFCKACGLTVFKREPSRYLSINIPQGVRDQNVSMQSSLDLFFRAEEVEHRCERCLYNKSVSLHKFGRLPRVVIIHLKRYSFNDLRVTKKDEQHILISKYLRLSFHCNKSTKPPPPLHSSEHVKNLDLLIPFEELGAEILNLSFNSVRASRSQGFPTTNNRSESEAQNRNRVSEVLSGKVQEEDPGKGSTANIVGSELTNENLKKHEKLSSLDSGSTSEATKDKDLQIPEKSQKYQQAEKCDEGRSDKQTSLEALSQGHPKPVSKEQTENLGKPTVSHTQNSSLSSQGSADRSKSSRNRDAKPTSKVNPQQVDEKEDNLYRLVNIISHIGNSPNGGHYINDAFDFKNQSWFTYSDLHVTSAQEESVYKARLSSGYVFFYMHNDIFEELLAKETQSTCTSKD
ncbi:ubiquitin carboxyl-terminal hydrolase 26 [Apodemus sylvaticus]|uniref:ubiquitin carboxyl-terminal hydrolase 26 n=1 Tax=Apodemus sylvaticus TaxID=10129 RepID=UPI00224468F0|nr:ubiquitin carboxyl-terminal hydrolase 26 [Apodemus sylvaticus]